MKKPSIAKNFFSNYLPTLIVMWVGIALCAGDFRIRTFNGYFLIHNDSGTIWFPLTGDRLLAAVGVIYTVALIPYYRLFPAMVSKARIAFSWLIRWVRRQHPHFGFAEKQAMLAIALKFFFLPLMLNFVINNLGIMAREYHALTTMVAGFHPHLYLLLLNLLFFVDVIIFTFGYMIEIPRLKNIIRSVEPTFLGWAVCLACYPPFNGMVNTVLPWQSSDSPHFTNPASQLAADWTILALITIYVWASVALGWKASNLTNRGVISHGPYRWVRHPGYFGGWLGFVGFGIALGNGIGMLLLTVCTLPAFLNRISVEERSLRGAFPDYAEYSLRVARFLPFVW